MSDDLLKEGTTGMIVHVYGGSPGAYEIEFQTERGPVVMTIRAVATWVKPQPKSAE